MTIPEIGGRPQVEGILTRGVELRFIPDPGNAGTIDTQQSGFCEMATAAAETRTLPDPVFKGQELDLTFIKDRGDLTMTSSSPVNQSGHTTLLFQDVGDHVRLIGFYNATDGWEWRVLASDFDNGSIS